VGLVLLLVGHAAADQQHLRGAAARVDGRQQQSRALLLLRGGEPAYSFFVSGSITGVLRIPQRMLTPHKSISLLVGFGLPVIFGRIGRPRFVGCV
jgi:hypothetical protein